MQGHDWKGEQCLSVVSQLQATCSLNKTHGIPQLLRTRSLDAAGDDLPQLGALLGRGSYGKVYKGGKAPLSAVLSGVASISAIPDVRHCPKSRTPSTWQVPSGLSAWLGKLLSLCHADQAPLISENCAAVQSDKGRPCVACAGRWKGAMVAVKIIEHSTDMNSKIDAFRETLVSANIHHPNVVATYKVITCGQPGMLSGQQTGRMESASGSYSACPAHVQQVVGQKPKPALNSMGRSHSGLETLQAWSSLSP